MVVGEIVMVWESSLLEDVNKTKSGPILDSLTKCEDPSGCVK